MRFGVFTFNTDESMPPDELAVEIEGHGFESFFVPEHTHIPTDRRSPYPSGGPLPREYVRTYDPFVVLAVASAVTEELQLGFGICNVAERDPITTAKAVASLDRLSGGRVLFGVGAGWNREELRNHGTEPAERFEVLVERVEAMRTIWTEDEAAYRGEHVAFEPIWSYPKPVRRPHPPVLVGGSGATVFDRVLAVGDGWMPVGWRDAEQLPRKIAQLGHLADESGRPRPSITIFGADPEDARQLASYRELGVERCLFRLPTAPRDEVLPVVARYAELIG